MLRCFFKDVKGSGYQWEEYKNVKPNFVHDRMEIGTCRNPISVYS